LNVGAHHDYGLSLFIALRAMRDFHLYLGLFISPFILVFAISVFFLVHGCRRMAHLVLSPPTSLYRRIWKICPADRSSID
jgi:hypothetical protein